MLATVQGNVQAELSTQKQQVFVDIVFLNTTGKAVNPFAHNTLPGLTVIGGFVHIGVFVIGRMAVKYGIGCTLVKITGLDMIAPGIGRQTGYIGCNIAPLLATVAGNLHLAIIGTYPDQVLVEWRLGNGEDSTVVFSP